MARCKRDRDEIGYFLPKFIRYGFIGLLSVVLLSESVGARGTLAQLQIAQQPVPAPSVPLSAEKQQRYQEGVKLYQEAQQLEKKGTRETSKQAINKSQQALKIIQELGLREEEVNILAYIANLYNFIDDYKIALEYLQQALKISRELKKPLLEATVLASIGVNYTNTNEPKEGLTYLEKAQLIFLAHKEYSSLATTLNGIATIQMRLGDTKKALNYRNEALKLYREHLQDFVGEADTLRSIAMTYSLSEEPSIALDYYEQALKIQRQRKDFVAQVQIITDIASLQDKLGNAKNAVESLKKALKLQQQASFNLSDQANTIANIGHIYARQADYRIAIYYYQQAGNLFQQAGNTRMLSRTFVMIANAHKTFSGDYQKALEFLDKALELQVDDKDDQAFTLEQKADIHLSQANYQQALDEYNKALTLQRSIPNPRSEARILRDIALVYQHLGDYKLSIETYNKVLDIYKRIPNKSQESRTLASIARVYEWQDKYEEALQFYKKALSLLSKDDYQSEIQALWGMTGTYKSLNDYPKALEFASRALKLSRKNAFYEEFSLYTVATVYRAKRDYKKSLDMSNELLSNYRKAGLRIREAQILGDMSITYELQKNYQQAINILNEELKIRRELKDSKAESNSFYAIAVNQRKLGKLETALTNIDEAIKIVENIRGNVKNPDLRTSYFATVQVYYKFYIDLLMELDKKNPGKNYDELALNASEKSRARVLLELLTEANAKIRKGAKPELLQKESDLLQQIDSKEALLQKQKSGNRKDALIAESIKKLETDLENLRNQYQQLQTTIRESSPKYASLKYPQPLNLQQIQQQLDKDTVLLQYSIGEERSYLWAVTPNSLNTYQLPGKKIIDLEAKKFRTGISSSAGLEPEVVQIANKLSKILLSQVADKITGKRLVIVADGALQTIPFAALPDPKTLQANVKTRNDKNVETRRAERFPQGNFASLQNPNVATKQTQKSSPYQPLMVNHEIVNLPSASTIAIQRQELRKPAPKQIAILADPVYSSTDCRFTSPDANCKDDDSKFERQIKQNSQPKTKSTESPINPELEIERSTLERSAKNLNRNGFFRLPNTAIEANTILDIFKSFSKSPNSIEALNFDANFDWATNPALNQFRILHFATHGFADEENPENSGIVLSQFDKQGKPIRGFLKLGDLFNQDYPAELIVLSACQTGLGKEVNGEGLVGLTRGLMYAGAERVAVSLWNVNDEGTSVLMREFYKEMLQGNKTPAAAMRAAQIKLWSNSKWQNPFYWAAFTVSGEWLP